MKAVFLVINYMPHQLISITTLIEEYGLEVHAFAYKENTEIPKNTSLLKTYELKDYSRTSLFHTISDLKPDLMVVAGWAVPDFVWVSKQINQKFNIPIATYSDTQWHGTIRQKINCIISKWHIQRAFTHIWVAGVYQYEYARNLGFLKSQIIYNSLSCNINLFNECKLDGKRENYPKNFLFIGRLVEVKGLDLLLAAWEQIEDKKGWSLTLVGNGNLKETYTNKCGIVIKDFMPQNQLIEEMKHAGCFILPSIFEPWALVIHEAAAAGLPIIATNVCGSAPHFVISGYNGYQVNPSMQSIKHAIEKIIQLDSQKLLAFSENSKQIAQNITPKLGAAQLLSMLKA